MKRILNIGLFSLLLVLLVGCNLDYAPENTLVDESVYKNEKTAEASLLGAYVRLNSFIAGAPNDQNNYANFQHFFLFGDLTTNNVSVRPTAVSFLAIDKGLYSATEHEGLLYNVWLYGYNAIDYANNVIAGIAKYGQYSSTVMKCHIAEAKFLRAYEYFAMLQLFGDQALLGNDDGLGLVMRLAPYNGYDPTTIVSRVTNKEVWVQIIRDLTEAIPDLSTDVPAVGARVRANQFVAKALLSRIYLYKGTYTNNQDELKLAAQYANEVLSSGKFSFSTSSTEYLTALFPYNYSPTETAPDPETRSGELIFYQPSRISSAKYASGIQYYYQKKNVYIPAERKSEYEVGDVRGYGEKDCLIGIGSPTDNPTDITSLKYTNADGYNDVLYFRLAEIKMTYAEALVRTTNTVSDNAVKQLNDIHQRAFAANSKPALYKASDFPSVNDFLKTLLKERNREMAYEGHYRWDLMRTNNFLNDSKLGALPSNKWNMPIPDYEVRISNGKVQQNSGF